MIVLGVDVESTGLLTAEDRIIELGWALWCTDKKKVLMCGTDLTWDDSYPVLTDEITRVTGIMQEDLHNYAIPPKVAFSALDYLVVQHKPTYLLAHNATNFDQPILMTNFVREGLSSTETHKTPWIDTRTDLPFPVAPQSMKLGHLAYDMGFINPFAHRALFDVLTMMKVVSQFDFNDIIEHSKIPWITVRAVVDFENKQRAKDRRFSWEKIGEETFPKQWVKKIKENKLDEEIEALKPFQVVRLK